MFGVWSFLRQFMYTKFIVVTDDDVDIRNWHDVIWAITTRMDPVRDTVLVDRTPIDSLDFASPVSRPRRQDGPRRDHQVAGRDRAASGAGRSATIPTCAARVAGVVAAIARDARRRPDRRPAGAGARPTAASRPAAPASAPPQRAGRCRGAAPLAGPRASLRSGLQPFRHADQDAARQRRVAVEHRLRGAHAATPGRRAASSAPAPSAARRSASPARRSRCPSSSSPRALLCQGPCSGPADWLALAMAPKKTSSIFSMLASASLSGFSVSETPPLTNCSQRLAVGLDRLQQRRIDAGRAPCRAGPRRRRPAPGCGRCRSTPPRRRS